MTEFFSRDDVLVGVGLVLLAVSVGIGLLIGATFGDCSEEISPRKED